MFGLYLNEAYNYQLSIAAVVIQLAPFVAHLAFLSWPRLAAEGHCLIVLGLELEVALRMVAHGAYLGSLLAHYHVATVAAYPDGVAFA